MIRKGKIKVITAHSVLSLATDLIGVRFKVEALGYSFSSLDSEGIQGTELSFTGSNSAEVYEGVSKSFRTGRLERELQMVQLSAIKCSCIAIL
jgi:hypothetical protein